MAKTMLVNSMPEETRMAIIEDSELVEVAVERAENGHIVGNIYKGKVQNVLPGMQAAFVDIGQEKNGYLAIGEIVDHDKSGTLTVGQEIVVQVAKDSLGTKGPRLTTKLTLPGRYVVLMPTYDYSGVSRRIENKAERERLRLAAQSVKIPAMGLIIRTVAEGKSEHDIKRDADYLANLWRTLTARAKRAKAPTLLYRDVDMVIRLVRDYFDETVEKFVIDNNEIYGRVKDLLTFIDPESSERLTLHTGQDDIFSYYGIADELSKLTERQIDLKCGGYIVIDRTEALTVIDVNTGKYTGHNSLADTILHTNLEATAEIARQIRLRDIGGIIIIDFIDMEQEEHRQIVLKMLNTNLKKDRTPTNVRGLTALGLVEMTRKKVRQDLETALYAECPCCGGRGRVRSPQTIANSVIRELRYLAAKGKLRGRIIVQIHPQVAAIVKKNIPHLNRELARQLTVEAVSAMNIEAYSILAGRE
ncbi:MAG: ribonuclease, Rne/Rng family [Firmicutes bacterium]|nr:ribonuclease, Rne/Rng family [Bacillota bacterium]